ncbi:MAG: type II toxin-antitoxin system PemK/MazF family toxin [Clostridium sp.]|nr:type II toxin-antitoxin system PemK/MazF family toxin [Clostridium sp.]
MINEAEKPRRDPSSVKNWIYWRGDIYLVDFDPVVGSEQGGVRPGLVLQNDIGNFFSPTMVVAPVTTQLKRLDLPTHVLLENVRGLNATSMAVIEQPKPIDKQRIRRYLGKINKEQMKAVEAAMLIEFGMEIPECVEAP